MSPKSNQFGPYNNPYRGESFPASELAQSLGSPVADSYRLESALRDLCRACVIRFGIPETARGAITTWLGIPSNPDLTYATIGQPIDPRWARLAEALELPKKGELPLISLALPSQSALHVLKDSTRELVQEIASLKLKPLDPSLGEQLRGIKDLRPPPPDPASSLDQEVYPIAVSAFRQARNFITLGPSFALITSVEQLLLRGRAQQSADPQSPTLPPTTPPATLSPPPAPLDRSNPHIPPDSRALEHLGMIWRWKEERRIWEPALPQSAHRQATLFDESSHYFARVLSSPAAQSYSHEKGAFLEALQHARERYQRERSLGLSSRGALRAEQERIFSRFLQ